MTWSFSFTQQYKNYNVKNGLPSNHVYAITQDYDGFIWIITDKGISKFDGKIFKTFTIKDGLPTNDIWDIRITPDNKIWFFSKSNKLGYILDDKVYTFSSKNNKILFPRIILQAQNKIAFNDGSNYYFLKDSLWKKQKNKTIAGFGQGHQKVLHKKIKYHDFNTNRDSIVLIKETGINIQPIQKAIVHNIIRHQQYNDSLYAFIGKNYYIIENFNTEKVTTISYQSQGLPKNLKYFKFHPINNKIQCTAEHFVGYLDDKLQIKNRVSIPEKLNSHYSFIDKTGNIWIATFNKGIYLFPNSKKEVKILGKDEKIQLLSKIDTTIFTGIHNKGFYTIKDSLNPFLRNNKYQYQIKHIKPLKTTLFSASGQLYLYKKKKLVSIEINRENYEDKIKAKQFIYFKDHLYGNNSFGVFKVNMSNYIINNPIKLYGITSYSKTNSYLFVGNQSGLLEIKNDSAYYLEAKGLFQKPVLSQAEYNSNFVIVGTEGFGAYLTNGKIVNYIQGSDNLTITDIYVDDDKSIWLASNNGVYKATKNQNTYKVIRSFYESDGLLLNNVNSIVIKNKELYAATDVGISIFNYEKEKENQLQKLYVNALKVNDKTIKNDTLNFTYIKNNLISISLGVINFENQNNLQYQYKLLPNQTQWKNSSSLEFNFNDLQPNTYQLQVKVTNHHHKELFKNITINISPLYYQTQWFKIGLLFLGLITVGLTAYNISKQRQLKKHKKVLQQKQLSEIQLGALRSQMNPHFVFNSLAAIQYYINSNKIEASEKYLVKFSKLIRQFFELSKENEISLDKEIELLKRYLDIEKLRFKEKFSYTINTDALLNLKKVTLPTMLLQPIVENAVNHGIFNKINNGEITIHFEYIDAHSFKATIIDNGVGEVNTIKKTNNKVQSSNVLIDRLKFLNQSGKWKVTHNTRELHPKAIDKGHISSFIITKLR